VGTSALRVLAGLLASAAVAGGFVCAVAVVNPGGGPAPRWPASRSSQAASLSMPRVAPGPADRARAFTPVLTPSPAVTARVPAARPRAATVTPAAAPVVSTPAPAASQPAPAAPARPTPTPAAPAPADPTPAPAPTPQPLQPLRHAAGQTVAVAAHTVARTVAPVSPPVAATVQQTGDTLAQLVSGP
jgi:hypothetical protein